MYRSWAYIPEVVQSAKTPHWVSDVSTSITDCAQSVLAFGAGRSYGDSCINSDGTLIDTQQLRHFISFDIDAGILTAEPGVTLGQLLKLTVPKGWFLSVTPGTSHATLGGALANDVHGKNHHCKGTFGHHVKQFKLLRTDGQELVCSEHENPDMFKATIGGMGLTGIITQITLSLQSIKSSDVTVSTRRFIGLSEYLKLSKESSQLDQYSVAWIDCMSGDMEGFKGLFYSANHAQTGELAYDDAQSSLSAPSVIPSYLLNKYSVTAFNKLYYAKNKDNKSGVSQGYHSFFYPLDKVANWNNIYGKNGFYQCQFILPLDQSDVFDQVFTKIRQSGMGSFLTVLKEFGNYESAGMLSFPRPGICLAMDFSNRGSSTMALLKNIEHLVINAGGSIYPAKDKLMSAESFRHCYPALDDFKQFVDPGISSNYWRRVSG